MMTIDEFIAETELQLARGCRNYAAHPKDKMFVDHAKLLAEIAKRKTAERQPGDE